MAGQSLAGQFFERVQITTTASGVEPQEFDALFSATVNSDEGLVQVDAFSTNHKASGFTRANQTNVLDLEVYIKYNQIPFDWTSLDYDNETVSMALLLPTSNFGKSNVFQSNSNYVSITGLFLASQSPLKATGVGQTASQSLIFRFVDWNWVQRNG